MNEQYKIGERSHKLENDLIVPLFSQFPMSGRDLGCLPVSPELCGTVNIYLDEYEFLSFSVFTEVFLVPENPYARGFKH